MEKHWENPKLRWPIELHIHSVEDQQVLLLSCPIGVAHEPLGRTAAIAPILACFEGNMSVDEITAKFAAKGLERELVIELVQLLDEKLFLEGPRFRRAESDMRRRFLELPQRPPALAGSGYPADSALLAKEIDSYLAAAKGVVRSTKTMLGLIAPHIDYRRGGATYGVVYKNLPPEEHSLFVILGTSHRYSKEIFHLTRKDFQTPLGTMHCDHELIAEVASGYGLTRSFADEILHRNEHSIELQIPFLQRLNPHARIMPILVGGVPLTQASVQDGADFVAYNAFLESLATAIHSRLSAGTRLCVIAGADMAHVGPAFGDSAPLDAQILKRVHERDMLYLEAIQKHDKSALLAHVQEDNDARRVCGFPTVYTMMDLLERIGLGYHTELFDYRQAVDEQGSCGVSFCGMGFYHDEQL